MDLMNAKKSLAAWGTALVRTDLEDDATVRFLAGSFKEARKWVAKAQAWVDRGCL